MSKNQKHISDIIELYLKDYQLDGKIKEVKLVNDWTELFGKAIDRHTSKILLQGKTLHVRVDSSVLRNELMYNRQSMIDRINEHFGEEVVDHILIK